jgi:hypothetical protein
MAFLREVFRRLRAGQPEVRHRERPGLRLAS